MWQMGIHATNDDACVGNIVSICHDFKCLFVSVGLYQLAHLGDEYK